jgi:excisionase family DNA binding protein
MTDAPTDTVAGPKLNVRGAAERYGITERYVRHLVATKRIPYWKVGNTSRSPLVFDQTELDAWFADHRVEAIG